MSLFANAHDLAQQREIEELRREIGALRTEREHLEHSLRIAHEDIADLAARVKRAER